MPADLPPSYREQHGCHDCGHCSLECVGHDLTRTLHCRLGLCGFMRQFIGHSVPRPMVGDWLAALERCQSQPHGICDDWTAKAAGEWDMPFTDSGKLARPSVDS